MTLTLSLSFLGYLHRLLPLRLTRSKNNNLFTDKTIIYYCTNHARYSTWLHNV